MVERDIDTAIVRGTRVVGRADGRVAIQLEFLNRESIALELTLERIQLLRKELALAETLLRQRPGTA